MTENTLKVLQKLMEKIKSREFPIEYKDKDSLGFNAGLGYSIDLIQNYIDKNINVVEEEHHIHDNQSF